MTIKAARMCTSSAPAWTNTCPTNCYVSGHLARAGARWRAARVIIDCIESFFCGTQYKNIFAFTTIFVIFAVVAAVAVAVDAAVVAAVVVVAAVAAVVAAGATVAE
jgi:hypothetical protein